MPSDYFDETYPEDVRHFLNALLDTIMKWTFFASNFQMLMGFIGVFLNILHIFILTQKSMRVHATNILILGIAISDSIFLMYYVDGGIDELTNIGIPSECQPPKSFSRAIWAWVLFICKDAFRRVSSWLGLFLAIIRYLVMKYGTRTNIQILMKTSTSWKLFFGSFVFSLVITSINQARYIIMEYPRWTPKEICTMYPPNTTFPWFERVQNPALQDFQRQISTKYLFIDGFFKIIPPIFYPFLAIGLVLQLKKARDGRRVLMRKEEEMEMVHVTKLVICMTFGYFLAEAPVGIAELFLSSSLTEDFGIIYLINYLAVLLITFLVINCSIHCFFCFALSSQYRQAVWTGLGCKIGRSTRNSVANSRNMSTTS